MTSLAKDNKIKYNKIRGGITIPRIISGRARGLKLETIPGEGTRPTADRVKEAFFNIIAEKIWGSSFADVFSGTGSMGGEALSRNADEVVFIDNDPKCREVILRNIGKIDLTRKGIVYCKDYRDVLAEIKPQDIFYVDPPYNKGLGEPCLKLISKYDLVKCGGVVVWEHDKTEEVSENIGKLIRYDERKYGRTRLSFYKLVKET